MGTAEEGGGNGRAYLCDMNDVNEKNGNGAGSTTTSAPANGECNNNTIIINRAKHLVHGKGSQEKNIHNNKNRRSDGECSNGWCLEPEVVTAEGRYTPVPQFAPQDITTTGSDNSVNYGDESKYFASSSSLFSEDLCITTDNRGDIHVRGTSSSGSSGTVDSNNAKDNTTSSSSTKAALLSRSKEQLVDEILALRRRLASWEELTSQIVSALALAPDSNEMYSRLLRTLLCGALRSVASIEEVRHVECSLPSIPAERPELSLVTWRSLSDSLWRIRWTPASWWVSVHALGRKWGLAFNALTTVSCISLYGTLRCAFSSDLTAIRVAFIEEPALDIKIKSEIVAVGMIPVPVDEQIEQVVRSELRNFICDTLVARNSSVIVLRRKPTNPVSKEDLEEAINAAHRANAVQLRSVK